MDGWRADDGRRPFNAFGPDRRLLQAIICVAIEDCCRPPTRAEARFKANRLRDQIQALRWLFCDSPALDWYAGLLEISVPDLRKRLVQAAHEDGEGSTFRPDQRRVFRVRYQWAKSAGLFDEPYDVFAEDRGDDHEDGEDDGSE
jgi:hypothetical protein